MSRLTIRARLTLVYGTLVLLAGLLMLAVTFALVSQGEPHNSVTTVGSEPRTSATAAPNPSPPDGVPTFTQESGNLWHDVLGTLLTRGVIAVLVVGAIAAGFSWLLAGRLLQPLHRVTETARRIAQAPVADRGLHERIALTGPHDEIKELADTFDVMLARLDRAFAGQRTFIANASHELRTPLTVNRSVLEVALHRGDPDPRLRQLGETLLEMNTRQERLLDALLLLARSERELTKRSYVDLADVAEHVTEQLDVGAIELRTELAEAPTSGNPALLERLVQNLVDNALSYNVREGGFVLVATSTRADGSAVLQVVNTGPVVPRYEVADLFEPFHRLGADRTGATPAGLGLGLSIVQAVTHAHGGTVAAEPREGGGLTVAVVLPAAP